jgi:uncharacterized protein YecE (DUF72 family)
MNKLLIGTSDWRYDSGKGIIYPVQDKINYLEEYSKQKNFVDVDQWLFGIVKLRGIRSIENYNSTLQNDFQFIVKVPDLITSSHYYCKDKNKLLKENPYYLSKDLFNDFIKSLHPLQEQVAFITFQFEYLDTTKKSSSIEFLKKLYDFFISFSHSTPPIAVELKNPYNLNSSYFKLLRILDISNVFLQDRIMPCIVDIYDKYKIYIRGKTIISIQSFDRHGIKTNSNSYIDREEELKEMVRMIRELQERDVKVYLNINDQSERNTPLIIEQINKLL